MARRPESAVVRPLEAVLMVPGGRRRGMVPRSCSPEREQAQVAAKVAVGGGLVLRAAGGPSLAVGLQLAGALAE